MHCTWSSRCHRTSKTDLVPDLDEYPGVRELRRCMECDASRLRRWKDGFDSLVAACACQPVITMRDLLAVRPDIGVLERRAGGVLLRRAAMGWCAREPGARRVHGTALVPATVAAREHDRLLPGRPWPTSRQGACSRCTAGNRARRTAASSALACAS